MVKLSHRYHFFAKLSLKRKFDLGLGGGMVDTQVSKTCEPQSSCRFESDPRHPLDLMSDL